MNPSRRDVLRQFLRWGALAGLAGGAAALVFRDGSRCRVSETCRRCGFLDRCTLPQARSERAAKQRVGNRR